MCWNFHGEIMPGFPVCPSFRSSFHPPIHLSVRQCRPNTVTRKHTSGSVSDTLSIVVPFSESSEKQTYQ
jgi:hypothetical protein